jgi:hypothetical protein
MSPPATRLDVKPNLPLDTTTSSSETTTAQRDDALALILALNAEISRVGILIGVCANIANALEAGCAKVRGRLLITYFPRESATLILSTSRFSRFYGASPLCPLIETFETALAQAKSETINFASSGFSSELVHRLAETWRSACRAGTATMAALHKAMNAYELTDGDCDRSASLELLSAAAMGSHSLVANDGTLSFPEWAERREFSRVAVRCAATLGWDGRKFPVILRDISMSGIGLEVDKSVGLRRNMNVRVDVGLSLSLDGMVAWANEGGAGIKLNAPLHTDDPRLRFCANL